MPSDVDLVHAAWRSASDSLSEQAAACLLAAECLRIIDPRIGPLAPPSPGPKASMAAIFVTHCPVPDDFAASGSPLSRASDLPSLDAEFQWAPQTPNHSSPSPPRDYPSPSPPCADGAGYTPIPEVARSPNPSLSPSPSPSPLPDFAAPMRPRRVTFGTLPRPQLLRAIARSSSPTSMSSSSSSSSSPPKREEETVRRFRDRLKVGK